MESDYQTAAIQTILGIGSRRGATLEDIFLNLSSYAPEITDPNITDLEAALRRGSSRGVFCRYLGDFTSAGSPGCADRSFECSDFNTGQDFVYFVNGYMVEQNPALSGVSPSLCSLFRSS